MQDVNRSLRRSSASSSPQTFLNLEYQEKAELKRVIDFLQEQYEGLASELASKELELKVAKSRRMPSQSFELRNQQYQTKSEINQLKFKHMTELQETMAEHQLEIDIIKNEFEEKLERQYENFKREFNRNKKETSGRLEEEIMELSEKNIELNRTISQLEIKLKEQERKAANTETEQELKHTKKLLIEKDAQIQRLERLLKESEQYIEEMKVKLSEKNREIDYFVSEMNRQKSVSRSTMIEKPSHHIVKIQKLEKSRSHNENELSDQLVFVKEENDRLRKLNDRYKSLVTEKEAQIEGLNQQIFRLEKQINSQGIKVQGLNQEIKEYQTGKKIFESEMSRLNENIQRGLGDVSTKQTEIRELNGTIDRLKLDGQILGGRLADQDSEKKRLEEIISRQNERMGLLEEEIRTFNIKWMKKEQETLELNGLIDHNKSEYKGLQIAFHTKQSEYEIVCNQNRQYLLNNQSLKNELNDSKRQADELKHKLHKTEQDNKDLLQSLKQLKIQYQNVRIENSTLKQFEDACSHLRNEIVQLEHQLKIVKEDNRRQIEQTYRYKLEYESALVQLQENQEKLKEIEAQRMEFNDRAELIQQLKRYTEVVQNTSKLNSQLSNEMRSLKEGNTRLAEEKLGLERKLERVEEKSLKSRVIDNSKVSSIGQLQSEVTRLQLLANNLENEKRFFEAKSDDATKQKQKMVSSLQRQLAELNSISRQKQDQSKHQLETVYKTINDAKQQIHQLKGELSSFTLENTKLKNSFKGEHELQTMEIEGLREELKRKIHENQTLTKRWTALKEEQMQRLSSDKHLNIMLESEMSAIKTKLDLTEVNLKDRQADIERLNNKYQKLQSEKQSMEIELDKFKIEQWKYRTGIQTLEGQKQSLTKELKSKQLLFQQQLNTLKSDNQELGANNEELAEYVKQLQKERNRLQMDHQMMSDGLGRVTKERNEAKEMLAKVEMDLASTRVENESLKRKKPDAQMVKASEVGKLREELEKERKTRREFEEQIEGFKKGGNVGSTIKQKEHKRRETTDQGVVSRNNELEMQIRRLNEQLRVNGIQFNELLKYRSDLQMKLIQTGDQLRKLRQQLSYKQQTNQPPPTHQRKDFDQHKMLDYIRELEMRCKLVEDINAQLRKKQYQQQEKVTRILADNKTELTHYKLQNNRLEKQKTELEMRIKHAQNHMHELQNERANKFKSTNQETNHLREELKNVYGQIHSLNNLLIQKQNQINNLIKNRQPMVFGSLQHISSPKEKEKKALKNTEDCWRDMQDRIKAGQKEFSKTRMHN